MKASCALFLTAALASVCASAQTTSFVTGQAARLVMGQVNFTTGDFGTTNKLLGSPSGIAYANGTLWVADANRLGATPDNNRVLRFSDLGTYPSPTQDPTIANSTCGICRGVASLVLGQPDFVSSNPTLTPAGMRNPTGVATDGNVVAVADTDNNRILIWLTAPTINGQTPDVVIGQPNFTSNSTAIPPNSKSLRGPTGLWIAGGKLYVADTQDNRILIYNQIPHSNNVAADVVVGQPDFNTLVEPDLTQASVAPAANNMQAPVSVTTDATHMYVTDLGQSRVLIFNQIPTSNNVAADVVVGQPDMVSAVDNNSFVVTDATLNSNNNPMGVAPVLCQQNGMDSDGAPLFPLRCGATLSFPRYALSDGTRLFVADGGNDRVLVYNTIPTSNGLRADVILGEPDEFTDNTGQNPSGSDAFQTPNTLAWDGSTNLYVSDVYNRRVVVYSPGQEIIPLGQVLNAASLKIYAIGSVSLLANAIDANDTVTIGINATCNSGDDSGGCYTYKVLASDTVETITTGLVTRINKAPGDPNVVAAPDLTTDTVVLTARVPDAPGGNITLSATQSANAQITATASGTTLNIYLQNPTSIAPGTQVSIFAAQAASLCDSTAAADMTQPYLPFTLNGCEIFIDGQRAPLMYVSPGQINAQMHVEYSDRTSVSLYSRVTHGDGSITVSTPIGVTIVPENPGVFAGAGDDPRPGIIFHGSSSAVSGIAFAGTATAGDVDTITINGTNYNYTVGANDTLDTIASQFASMINSAPDPNVTVSVANQFTSILFTALTPGAAGTTITIAQSVGTNATEILTVLNDTMCCNNTQGALVTPDNPAIPGELLYVYATGLGPTNPSDQASGQIYQLSPDHAPYPPATPVDSILAGGTSANIMSSTLVPGTVGVYQVQFLLGTGQAVDANSQLTIAQQAHVSNVVTFAVAATATDTDSSSGDGSTDTSTPATSSSRRPMGRPAVTGGRTATPANNRGTAWSQSQKQQ